MSTATAQQAPKQERAVPVSRTLTDFFKGMPTRGRALLEMTVQNILYDRKTIVFFALTLFLLVLPSYWVYADAADDIAGLELFIIITMIVYIQFIVLYACMLFGASLFVEEEEQRTMTYIISRPISNLEIVFYKYVGFVISVFVMLVIPLLINFGIICLRTPYADTSDFMFELGQFIGLLFVAIAAWGAFFMFLGIYLKKYALMAGLLYALFWETFISNIPTSIRLGTVNHYVRSIAPIYVSFDDQGLMDPTVWNHALAVLIGFSLVFVIMSYIVLRKKDYH
jgi:ABC-type transport system involved in multi-copper enzyme maturation permease subunit